jgi:hypothetical protein
VKGAKGATVKLSRIQSYPVKPNIGKKTFNTDAFDEGACVPFTEAVGGRKLRRKTGTHWSANSKRLCRCFHKGTVPLGAAWRKGRGFFAFSVNWPGVSLAGMKNRANCS